MKKWRKKVGMCMKKEGKIKIKKKIKTKRKNRILKGQKLEKSPKKLEKAEKRVKKLPNHPAG